MTSYKMIVESVRSIDGYAGMAIYNGAEEIFIEGMPPELVLGMMRLYGDIPGVMKGTLNKMSAYIKGYSIHVSCVDGLLILVRVSGMDNDIPGIAPCEADFIDPEPLPALPSREKAAMEAEELLKKLKMI
ncbi:hypothetical protein [Methanooceanicella nereidis]|nr:hypothetical protein [Methanocella sp. CWC-04]